MKATIPSIVRVPNKKTLCHLPPKTPAIRAALEIFLSLHSRLKERGQSIGEEYARGIQIFKNIFIQYGRQDLADNLPELPLGGITSENNQVSITAPGSSQQLQPEMPPRNSIEVQMEDDQENPSIIAGPPDEGMTDDNFTLSGAATPAQDELDMVMSQMDEADIESELKNLLTIDDSNQYPPLVAKHSTNLEPAGHIKP